MGRHLFLFLVQSLSITPSKAMPKVNATNISFTGAASSLTLTPKCSRAKQDTVKGMTVKSSSPGVVKGVKPSHQRKSPHDE